VTRMCGCVMPMDIMMIVVDKAPQMYLGASKDENARALIANE
jgi:hypothetical protein